MLAVLATHWRLLVIRGVVAALFGIATLAWPDLTVGTLVMLFAAYALIDGFLALMLAFGTPELPGFAAFLIEGIVGVVAAIAAVVYPSITTVELLVVIAGWAIVTGIASIAAALILRRELTGEWPLPVAGSLLVILGTVLLLNATAGAVAMAWLIGLFAIFVGVALLALAMRLRQLAQEIARA
jgi:uncharacterized membrane protein HdeD (DUF308 family)